MSKALSPIISLGCGYIMMFLIILTLYLTGFYSDNSYFHWGPPIIFFDSTITTSTTFYLLLVLIFFHQLITNWIYEVVYPWIINNIQNPRHTTLEYNKTTCLCIVNFNSLYSQIHLAFIINGITSQISFLLALICADIFTLSYINWHYIKDKTITSENDSLDPQDTEDPEIEIEIT